MLFRSHVDPGPLVEVFTFWTTYPTIFAAINFSSHGSSFECLLNSSHRVKHRHIFQRCRSRSFFDFPAPAPGARAGAGDGWKNQLRLQPKTPAPAPAKKTRLQLAPAPIKFAMVSAKMMIPVQTGISGIFSNTIKCN